MPSQQIVPDTLVPPFTGVCRFFVTRLRGGVFKKEFTSSGFLIGNRHLLTAAHNFATFKKFGVKSKVINATCRLGAHEEERFFEISDFYRPKEISIPKRYRAKRFRYDYCLITLKQQLDFDSPFELIDLAAAEVEIGDEVLIAGYPNGSKLMYWGRGKVLESSNHLLTYDIDTQTGNSGGPVWVKKSDGRYIFVGVHVMKGLLGAQTGTARVVNSEMLESLRDWGLFT